MSRIASWATAALVALNTDVALPASAKADSVLDGTLRKIKETGAITLAHREFSVPFSYYDDKQRPVGYAMDLCYRIVAAVKRELRLDKLEVKLNPVTAAMRIPLIANGTVDLECGSTTNSVERQKQVTFTITHFVAANRFVSKKANNLRTVDDLKGKTVVSTSGSNNIKQIIEINAQRNLGMNILNAKDHPEAFLMVETDRVAAFDGRHPALRHGGECEDAGRLPNLGGPAFSRTLRHHAATRRSGLQEGRRRCHDRLIQKRRDRRDLRQVVHEADSAKEHQLERTHGRCV